MNKPLVGIVMGSDSDFSIMEEASKVLEEFNVAHEVLITSAHRTPERTRNMCKGLNEKGFASSLPEPVEQRILLV